MPILEEPNGFVNGFEHLLDIFPFARTINSSVHQLTVSHRDRDGSPIGGPKATLLIRASLSRANFGRLMSHVPALVLRRWPRVELVYEIEVTDDVVLDWEVRHWDHIRLPRSNDFSGVATYQTLGMRPTFAGQPLALILCRPIRRLSVKRSAHLNSLNLHLTRRRTLGLANIPSLALPASHTEEIPTFLAKNAYIRNLELSSRASSSGFDLIGFFELDWSPLRLTEQGGHSLRKLTIPVTLRKWETKQGSRIALRKLAWTRGVGSLLRLEKLTFNFTRPYASGIAWRNLPPLSLIARTLMCFGGTHCVFANELPREPVMARNLSYQMHHQMGLIEELDRLSKELEFARDELLSEGQIQDV